MRARRLACVGAVLLTLCASVLAADIKEKTRVGTKTVPPDQVRLCRTSDAWNHHEFLLLSTDCMDLLRAQDDINPFTGEFTSAKAAAAYADAGCPLWKADPDTTLRRRFLLALAHTRGSDSFTRIHRAFTQAGLSADQQSYLMHHIRHLVQRDIGLSTVAFVDETHHWCNVDTVCHVSDACGRAIIAAMTIDLLASKYDQIGAVFHDKFQTNAKAQQTHVDTIVKVQRELKEATKTCDVADIVRQRMTDTGISPRPSSDFNEVQRWRAATGNTHNCWTFIKKFKWTAQRLCKEPFWKEQQCGPTDCKSICSAKAAKTVAAERIAARPPADLRCYTLSLMHLCRRVDADGNSDWLEDTCVSRSMLDALHVDDGADGDQNTPATVAVAPQTPPHQKKTLRQFLVETDAAGAAALVKRWCPAAVVPAAVLKETVQAMLAIKQQLVPRKTSTTSSSSSSSSSARSSSISRSSSSSSGVEGVGGG